MSEKTLFHSRKLFIFNLVLVGIVAGFVLALFAFSCSTRLPAGDTAHAQETTTNSSSSSGVPLVNGVPSFRNVAAKVLPTVVEVTVVDVVKQPVPDSGQGFPFNFLLPPFGGQGQGQGQNQPNQQNQQNPPQTQEFKQEGLGSGVMVKRTGDTIYVLTNNHVVGSASEIKVKLSDNREFTAKLVGTDSRKDLALISFTTKDKNIPIATLGNSNDMQVGDWVLAIGNPFGFQSTVTAGIVSALGRQGVGPGNTIDQFIQTDAAINRGNSGGALVNMEGQVIGINDWIVAPSGGSVGLGFAIAINDAKKAISDFIQHGSIQYGWLGVSVQDPYPSLAKEMKIDNKEGSFVYHVFQSSPAEKGGIEPGDFITSINGKDVKNTDDLIRMVGDLPAGQDATFKLIRFGQVKTETVKIGLRKDQAAIEKNRNLWPGFSVLPLDSQIRDQLKLSANANGIVVVNVVDKTPAAVAGLQQGDLIKKINNQPVQNAMQFYQDINESQRHFTFEIERQGSTFNIGINK